VNYSLLSEAVALLALERDTPTLARVYALAQSANLGCSWFRKLWTRDGSTAWHVYGTIADDTLLEEIKATAGRIILYIDSTGGSANPALALAEHLAGCIGSTGVVTGRAFSAAATILAGCSTRIMRPGARLMLHDVTASVSGNSATLRQVAERLDETHESTVAFLTRRTAQPDAVVRGWLTGENYFSATEAAVLGLVDSIQGPCNGDPEKPNNTEPQDIENRIAVELAISLRRLQFDRAEVVPLLKPIIEFSSADPSLGLVAHNSSA
jgi:ATP-dependent protease ClpP protease subunit